MFLTLLEQFCPSYGKQIAVLSIGNEYLMKKFSFGNNKKIPNLQVNCTVLIYEAHKIPMTEGFWTRKAIHECETLEGGDLPAFLKRTSSPRENSSTLFHRYAKLEVPNIDEDTKIHHMLLFSERPQILWIICPEISLVEK